MIKRFRDSKTGRMLSKGQAAKKDQATWTEENAPHYLKVLKAVRVLVKKFETTGVSKADIERVRSVLTEFKWKSQSEG